VSFKPGPEDCYGRCGSDKIWQTVPDTCSGNQDELERSLTSLDICHLTKLVSKVMQVRTRVDTCTRGLIV